MSTFKIFSDSSCDLPDELIAQYEIGIVPFYVSFDDINYLKEKIDITNDEFYKRLADPKNFPKTSLPAIIDYADAFRPYLQAGEDIVCFCLTSKFSGSYQSAYNAGNILSSEFPERKIIIIDSKQATASQGLLVLECAYMREAGYSIEQLEPMLHKLADSAGVVFAVDDLMHLQRGGRIGKASAFAGSLLNIKPVIKLSEGELVPISKVRGRKRALIEVINNFISIIDDSNNYRVALLKYGYPEDAVYLQTSLKENHNIDINLPAFDIGVTIGTHIGPTATGIAYIKKYNFL